MKIQIFFFTDGVPDTTRGCPVWDTLSKFSRKKGNYMALT